MLYMIRGGARLCSTASRAQPRKASASPVKPMRRRANTAYAASRIQA
ncbi:hypothetical protein M271_31785 [Streptomyces rapamycinicus NRRL 5491]|nr:hypothetical protein M271_31785 [Streptomyces rapamycinicus NRRL 5491]